MPAPTGKNADSKPGNSADFYFFPGINLERFFYQSGKQTFLHNLTETIVSKIEYFDKV